MALRQLTYYYIGRYLTRGESARGRYTNTDTHTLTHTHIIYIILYNIYQVTRLHVHCPI